MLQADIDQINKVVTVLNHVAKGVDDIDVRTSAKRVGACVEGV